MPSAAISGKTIYTKPSDTEFVATRVFDAPRDVVFDAHTKCEHVSKWLLGPEGWSMPVCEIDLRPGGKWRYVWRRANEKEFEMSGMFKEVNRPSGYSATERWTADWPETTNIYEFTERGGKTTMKLTIQYPSKDIRDKATETGMTGGMDVSYDRLDALLGRLGGRSS